ncbi:Tol-Pal system protein TolB [Pseudoalteromonas sp. CIP111854]|uniref:Tol-Pal system protein TolB n=1 Tax=Pseudoalteromonas holothuriae TaxID=2963714 RepID=A0A9W4QTU3_9GAMM|nr:winged helix-turn-helix domain-containing protein [Pseudoalteromonas sp. CIP111854]CAH9053238.1 Tol-Pal system protein TolB [Pseudoalteromonas sp. CIP111854]
MVQQYWVGDFFIDLSRNQITKNEETQTLAPKAMRVLTHLANNQGKVISQDALLDHVWQGTVVSPNTLQRSIAQLRRAFGDDGKDQAYIKTHAKQGYSLECNVRWGEEEPAITSANAKHSTRKAPDKLQSVIQFRLVPMVLLTVLMLMILGATGYRYMADNSAPQLVISHMRALTATDNKESAGIYSPDGQYIVFHRFSEQECINNIWAKEIKSQQEFQLTKELGVYSNHSLSPDGQKLTFISIGDCAEPITQKKCYQLVNLDFNKALHSSQLPTVLMECKTSKISNPIWLSNNNIALMQQTSDSWKLINYSVDQNRSEVIYEIENGSVIDYDFSLQKGQIALTSIHGDGHYYIDMLKPNGEVISSNRIILPEGIGRYRFIYPNFSPLDDRLIFSIGKRLFMLATDGTVSRVSLPLDEPIGTPKIHPHGNKMLAIKGYYDSDIISMPISDIGKLKQHTDEPVYAVLQRSNVTEDSAKFQPSGELVAFKSERSGEDQVWIADKNGARQLSQFSMDTYLYDLQWAKDGKSILVNADKEFVQLFLDGTVNKFDLKHAANELFHWDSVKQTALTLIWFNGKKRLAQLNLVNPSKHVIYDKTAVWAQKNTSGDIIFTDLMGRFWYPGPAEDQLIEALNGQGSDRRFVVNKDIIYGINDDFELWSYSLSDGEFKLFGDVPKNIDYVTDSDGENLLMSIQIASRKEVLELYFEH